MLANLPESGGTNVTIVELERKLVKSGVPKHAYSLTGGLPVEAYCLEQTASKWHFYYSERGEKNALKVFDLEHEACNYFYNEIIRACQHADLPVQKFE
jgi:hypothetical protein